MSGHGGNPGKFESCRTFKVSFHNTYLVHPGTKTTACLHGESYTEKYGQLLSTRAMFT